MLFICLLSLFACIKPYQPDIQQGNIINNNDLKEIRYGMNKQEVLFLLGTPLVSDPFNLSRWDYYYSNINQSNRQTQKRLITVIFENDNLVDLKGDINIANLHNLEPSLEDKQHGGTVITKPTHKEKGIWNRLFKKNKLKKKKKKSSKKK